jgi:hypothetical protein
MLGRSPKVELPAERDQGLGTCIRERTTGRSTAGGRYGLVEGELDFHFH